MTIDRRTFIAGLAGAAARPWRWLDDAPAITVAQGVLRGSSEDGLRVFRGVPFAKPPVGDLRFRPPAPPQVWADELNATHQAAPATQAGQAGSEDCLYLNLWAPAGDGPFPILVWIHGGGNEGGGTRGQSGASFARLGIIVVTVAYRLGSFGFLELGDVLGPEYAGSGDNGIRDLEAALRWVRENARAFGGDPARITIAGQSAGAKDVAALMGAPSTRGLFARAIMESGSGQTIFTPEPAHEVANVLLAALNLNGGEARSLLTLPARQILVGQQKMEQSYSRAWPFRPFVGGAYLPKRPVDAVDGRIPLLIGTNRDESLAFFPRSDADKPIRSREVANAPFSLFAEVEAKYPAAFPEISALDRRIRLLTAEEYWIPSVRFAEANSRHRGATWMYRFDHTGESGYAVHGSELAYVWEHRAGWTMHETWASFIQGQSPDWPMYDSITRATHIYGQDGLSTTVSDPRGDERRLWEGVL